MSSTTTNLNLTVYNSVSDAPTTFLSYRNATSGDISSNMTKVDTWAGTVNSDIEALKNKKVNVLLNANYVSVGYYEITTTEVTSYSTGLLITLKPDTDNDGTTTIKINSLAVKSLMKYDATGSLVNLEAGDLRTNHEYSFRYDGTRFVWQSGTSADQLNIQGNEDELVSISENNTLQSTGISIDDVLLNSDISNVSTCVESDNKVLNAVQLNPSVSGTLAATIASAISSIGSINDTIGNGSIITTAQTLKGGINEIVGTINGLLNTGIVNPGTLPASCNLNDYTSFCIKKYNDYDMYSNSKRAVDGVYRLGTFIVFGGLENSAVQIVIPGFKSSNNNRDIIFRYRVGDTSTTPYTYTWTSWMTIPTEEKGSLPLINGWTNYGNGRSDFGYVKQGSQVFLKGVIKGGSGNIFATLPSNLIPSKAQILYCHSTSNSNINSTRFDIWTNGDVSISVYDTTNAISLDGVNYTI